jgi:protein-L-isoaspartate(D-aspartate) O-methyltransferase
MADYAALRFNMVEAQVRTNDVTEIRIHDAMREVPRERFVPTARRALAYADVPVEIANGRYMLDPRSFAKMLQLADLSGNELVLDVACGTGYSTVVLARLARHVIALEQDADLVRIASDLVPQLGAVNATVVQGGLTEGFAGKAPYDVIMINGAIEQVPDSLTRQLAEGGRLIAIVQDGPRGRGQIFVREHGGISGRAAFEATVPALTGFRKVVGFVF